jgi:haloalkane dehalogenase
MSQFTVEELRDCGLGAVWIGVESFLSDDGTTEDTYAKRRGEDIKKRFRELNKNGIQITASLVLGFDFHTRDNLKEDIDKFIDLKPFLYQLAPLTPCPGTPLFERMLEEDRLRDDYKWEHVNIWKDDVFKPKNFKQGELKKYYDYAHERIRDDMGPPPLQGVEIMMDAYQTLKNADGELNAYKAQKARRGAMGMYTMLHSIKRNHPSIKVRERALMLERRYKKEIGEPPIYIKAASRYISGRIRKKLVEAPDDVVSDPIPRWTYYHTHGSGDEMYVKWGHKPKKPEPYKDRGLLFQLYRR